MPASEDYAIPAPSKIKLKETKADKAHRLYKREQKRAKKEEERIRRANAAYATTPPPPPGREESITPPRNSTRTSGPRNSTRTSGPPTHAGLSPSASPPHRQDREEWAEKMAWMAAEEDGPFADFDPFPSFGGQYGFGSGLRGHYGFTGGFGGFHNTFHGITATGQRVPLRHQRPPNGPGLDGRRDPAAEVHLDPNAPVPPLGSMTDDEYIEFIRTGIKRKRHQRQAEEQERRRQERREREAKADAEAQRREEAHERKRRKEGKSRRNATAAEASQTAASAAEYAATSARERIDARSLERARWRRRVAALVDGEVVSVELGFADVPWPVYAAAGRGVEVVLGLDDLTLDKVQEFLSALAKDEGVDLRKVLRDAIRIFHPDRFFGRMLPRVKETEREAVKEGVERCSRLINELLGRL